MQRASVSASLRQGIRIVSRQPSAAVGVWPIGGSPRRRLRAGEGARAWDKRVVSMVSPARARRAFSDPARTRSLNRRFTAWWRGALTSTAVPLAAGRCTARHPMRARRPSLSRETCHEGVG